MNLASMFPTSATALSSMSSSLSVFSRGLSRVQVFFVVFDVLEWLLDRFFYGAECIKKNTHFF